MVNPLMQTPSMMRTLATPRPAPVAERFIPSMNPMFPTPRPRAYVGSAPPKNPMSPSTIKDTRQAWAPMDRKVRTSGKHASQGRDNVAPKFQGFKLGGATQIDCHRGKARSPESAQVNQVLLAWGLADRNTDERYHPWPELSRQLYAFAAATENLTLREDLELLAGVARIRAWL